MCLGPGGRHHLANTAVDGPVHVLDGATEQGGGVARLLFLLEAPELMTNAVRLTECAGEKVPLLSTEEVDQHLGLTAGPIEEPRPQRQVSLSSAAMEGVAGTHGRLPVAPY